MKQKIVLTVCSGNIHRLVIAESCLSRKLRDVGWGKGITRIAPSIKKCFE